MSLTPVQFEAYLKNEIMLNKARQMLTPLAIVTPAEVVVCADYYDEITVSYAIRKLVNLNYAVDVTEAEARGYFDGHGKNSGFRKRCASSMPSYPWRRRRDLDLDEEDYLEVVLWRAYRGFHRP